MRKIEPVSVRRAKKIFYELLIIREVWQGIVALVRKLLIGKVENLQWIVGLFCLNPIQSSSRELGRCRLSANFVSYLIAAIDDWNLIKSESNQSPGDWGENALFTNFHQSSSSWDWVWVNFHYSYQGTVKTKSLDQY